MNEAISTEGVVKSFRGRRVLEDVSWSVPQGSIHGLIGANGAGKTTLLRLALGVLWPDAGRFEVLGTALGRENAALRHRVHYVSPGGGLPSNFRVAEWLRYVGLLYQNWDAARAQRLVQALELDVSMAIGQLSTGQQMGLKLAAAIAARPELLLLDEPTNGLDVVVKRQVLRLIIDMAAAEGTTLVMASHNIEDIERMAEAVSVLYRGRLILHESMDNMKSRIVRLQVVLPGPLPQAVEREPAMMSVERRGHVVTLTIDGDPGPIAQACREAGATLVEPVPLDLSEIFTAVLEREGYTREQVDWKAI